MNKEQAEALKKYIDAAIQHSEATRQIGEDGYPVSAQREQIIKEKAWKEFESSLKE